MIRCLRSSGAGHGIVSQAVRLRPAHLPLLQGGAARAFVTPIAVGNPRGCLKHDSHGQNFTLYDSAFPLLLGMACEFVFKEQLQTGKTFGEPSGGEGVADV